MAIEVSDGFGIVLRAIRLNHQTFPMNNIANKYSTLSKILTNDHKNMRKNISKPDGVETVWRQRGEYRTQKSWCYVVSRQITIEQQTSILQKPDGSSV